MSRRTHRVADLLRSELSSLILREVHDPRVKLASVANIDVSPDLKKARVQMSVLGEDVDRENCVVALNHARGFLRSRLAQKLKGMRVLPELHFELDRGAEHSQQISDLLENIHDH